MTYRKIKDKDLTDFIFSKIIPVAATHAEMYSKVRQHFGQEATPEILGRMKRPAIVTIEVL